MDWFLTSLSTALKLEKGICSYSTTENNTNHEWLPLPWLQFQVESYPPKALELKPHCTAAILRIWPSICVDDDLSCHGKVYHVVSAKQIRMVGHRPFSGSKGHMSSQLIFWGQYVCSQYTVQSRVHCSAQFIRWLDWGQMCCTTKWAGVTHQ